MNAKTGLLRGLLALGVFAVAAGQLMAQGGPPWAGRGGGQGRGPAWARQGTGPDQQFVADREAFHFLLQNHQAIRREVKNTPTGVVTRTESDNPEIAAKIQEHVAAMAQRVEQRQPIRMRDPLFAELFRYADKIALKYKKTPKGVRVVETSDDPYVAKLIQAHGGVVSLFVKDGFAEAWKNHAVPGDKPATPAVAAGAAPGCPLAAVGACPKAAAGQCPQAAAGPCPKAAAGTGPKAAASACPAGGNCANCPAAKPGLAGQNCPYAKPCPAGKDGPPAPQCPSGKACAQCPSAGTCPLSGATPPPPLPQTPAAK